MDDRIFRRFLQREFARLEPAISEWVCWEGGTVLRIAMKIDADAVFADLPVLADALEDAGCTDPDVLEYFRYDGPHFRACWPVDLLLLAGCGVGQAHTRTV